MAKWGTKNPPKKKGRYLVTIDTPFGRQVRQADRCEYPKGIGHGAFFLAVLSKM